MRPVNDVVVIGRDAPAWMAAAAIVRSLGAAGVKVRVIELPSLLKATDCYSALPALDGYHLRVGLNDRLVWTTCKAVPVAGQRFNGWGGAGAPVKLRARRNGRTISASCLKHKPRRTW